MLVKILHWYRSMDLEMGGVVRAVLDISGALADRGHDQVIATFDPADLDSLWVSRHVDVRRSMPPALSV